MTMTIDLQTTARRRCARGTVDPAAAVDAHRSQALRAAPFEDLGFARVDHIATLRQGFPEVILGLGKTPAQIAAIAARIVAARSAAAGHPRRSRRRSTPCATSRRRRRITPTRGPSRSQQADIAAGNGTISSRAPARRICRVAEEAARHRRADGQRVERLYDVGVAGIHRLLGERDRLRRARVIIVVAGMEGALPSVVAGLVGVPVIAVPTSVGYGASFGGIAALLGMLNSCANGVSVVNIDNGFGAACDRQSRSIICRHSQA